MSKVVLIRCAAVVAAAFILSSCAEYEARRQQEQAQAQAAQDNAQCSSYGAAPGSQAYIQCRMNLDNQRAQMRAALASQLMGRMMTPPPQPQTLNVNVCNVPGQVNTCMYR